MISPSPVGWLQALPVLLVTLGLLLAPGAVVVRLLRCPRLAVVGLAGPVSVALVATGTVAASLTGLPWTPATYAGAVVLAVLLAWLVGRRRDPVRATAPRWGRLLAPTALVAALVGALPAMAVMRAANAVPQHPDTIYHLGTIGTMVRLQEASTFQGVAFVRPGASEFYPAAFHGLGATLVELTGTSPVVAANALALVLGFVVWPLGTTFLAATCLGDRPGVVLVAPVAAVVHPAFPTWALGYGTLWPNLAGQALLPAVLALLVVAVQGPSRWPAALGVVLLVPVLAVAHTSAVVALGAFGIAVVVVALVTAARSAGSRRRTVLLVVTGTGVLVSGLAWAVVGRRVPVMFTANAPGPEMSLPEAVLDVLFAGFRSQPHLWVVSALALAGLVLAARRPRARWLLLAAPGVALLYVLVTAVDTTVTRGLTWPWYNNAPRISMVLVLPLTLLVVVAVDAAVTAAARRRAVGETLLAATASVLLVLVTVGGNAPQRTALLDDYFPPDDEARFVSRAELAALEDLGTRLPPGAVVAANPWRGGQYLALVSDARMLFPTEKSIRRDPDQQLLGRRLDAVAEDPEACAAAERSDVGWALVGGRPANSSRAAVRDYTGVDGVGSAPGWRRVASAAPYTLFERTACARGADG